MQLEGAAGAVENAVRQTVVAVAKAGVAVVTVELGDQLVNAVIRVDGGKPQTGTAVGRGDLIKAV